MLSFELAEDTVFGSATYVIPFSSASCTQFLEVPQFQTLLAALIVGFAREPVAVANDFLRGKIVDVLFPDECFCVPAPPCCPHAVARFA